MNAQRQVRTKAASKSSFTRMHSPLLQRCTATQECEDCRKKRLTLQRRATDQAGPSTVPSILHEILRSPGQPFDSGTRAFVESRFGHDFSRVRVQSEVSERIQFKSVVSQNEDPHEREADKIAQQVEQIVGTNAMQEAPVSLGLFTPAPMIQRATADETDDSVESDASEEPEGEATSPEAPAAGLIVDDDAESVEPGQMRKSDFLAAARAAISSLIPEDQVETVDQQIEVYSGYDSAHLEHDLHAFAPETTGATAASEYIPAIRARVAQALGAGQKAGRAASESRGGTEGAPSEGGASSGSSTENLSLKKRDGGSRADATPRVIQSRLGSGRSLDSRIKGRMERAFGYGFSHVRVHADARSADLSARLNARAFTIGHDVAFGAGEYQPGTLIGDALIAHELAHVVQQGSTNAPAGPMQMGDAEYDGLEEEADRSAVGVIAAMMSGISGRAMEIAENTLPHLRSGLRLSRCNGCKGCGPTPSPNLTPPTVQINSAAMESDQISIELAPTGTSGDLTLQLTGPNNASHTVRTVPTAGAGVRNESFDIPNLPNGEFDNIRATWRVGSVDIIGNFPFHIKVLGMFRHSQYNIPHEDQCGGNPVAAYITNAACVFTPTTLRQTFLSQVNLNGSGVSMAHGNLVREAFCLRRPGAPANANGRSFRGVAAFSGTCGGALNNSTVARCDTNADLGCNVRLFINTVGIKTVTDRCPACCGHNQLDNFTTNGACAGIADLGNFKTIKLF